MGRISRVSRINAETRRRRGNGQGFRSKALCIPPAPSHLCASALILLTLPILPILLLKNHFNHLFYLLAGIFGGQIAKAMAMKQIGIYLTIPFVLAVPPVLGWLIGRWLDNIFSTTPILMYVFILLGFASGFREVYRIIKRYGNGT